ncbi:hypothetical protein OBBRIDRAFT_793221 [Obba rivulosa]|uniref:Uncharacterized protein n=1 Tax=Obba rivulosa TaxID=1052685 RepID=A0A8E2AYS3_9APHY|nr:hypothetical protein OBBRIDRAFT_793221 [Obba rivulosa]
MSTEESNGVSKPSGGSLDSDLALLSLLLQQSEANGDEGDVIELLRRLESADGIARDVESRLDDMIGGLDSLLGALEPGAEGTIVSQSTSVTVIEDVGSREEVVVSETQEQLDVNVQKDEGKP